MRAAPGWEAAQIQSRGARCRGEEGDATGGGCTDGGWRQRRGGWGDCAWMGQN